MKTFNQCAILLFAVLALVCFVALAVARINHEKPEFNVLQTLLICIGFLAVLTKKNN